MEYRYIIRGYGKTPILRVELVSEAAKFATIIEDWFGKPRERRIKKDRGVFTSFKEAHDEWKRKLQINVDSARQNLQRANAILGNAKGLKNPYEGDE